jgi:hypothetical protein
MIREEECPHGCEAPRRALVVAEGAPLDRIVNGVAHVVHTFSPPAGHRIAWTRHSNPDGYFRVLEPNVLLQLLEVRDEVIVAQLEPTVQPPARAMLLVVKKEASREPLIVT